MKGIVLDDRALLMVESDTVATALDDLERGTELSVAAVGSDRDRVTLTEDIAFGHKFAIERIDAGDPVEKYGERIGSASRPIEPGEWVHTHNCESDRGRGDRTAEGANA